MAGFKKSDGSYSIEKRGDGKTYLTVPPSGTVYVTGGVFGANNGYAPVVYNDVVDSALNYRFAATVPAVMGETTGYIAGGRFGYAPPNPYGNVPHPSWPSSTAVAGSKQVYSFPFTTNGSTTDVGDLINYASSTVGINARHEGFGFVGTTTYDRLDNPAYLGPIPAANTSAIPSSGFPVKRFDKITFAAPVTVSDVGELSGAFSFRGAAGHTSTTKGYVSGGAVTEDDSYNLGLPYSGPTLYPYAMWTEAVTGNLATTKTQSFPLASMPGGTATDVVDLYDTTYTASRGFSSTDYGYVMGTNVVYVNSDIGSNSTVPYENPIIRLDNYGSIKKFPFASETSTAVTVGDYNNNRIRYQAVSAKFKGYSIGRGDGPYSVTPVPVQAILGLLPNFYPTGSTPIIQNESFSFTSDANAADIGTLIWPTPVSGGSSWLGGTGVAATNDRGYITGAIAGGYYDYHAILPNYDDVNELTHITSFPFAIESGDVSADVWDASSSAYLTRNNSTLAS